MKTVRLVGSIFLFALCAVVPPAPAQSGTAATLVIACAGDSLMRPMPVHFRALAPAAGLNLEIREWAQGGLSSETYPSFFRRLQPEGETRACDAILLQLGTNDAIPLLEERWSPAEFRARLAGILAEFGKIPGRRRPRPLVFLATVPLFCDRPESAAKNRIVATVINPILRDLARAGDVVLVDNGAVLDHHPALVDPDCVHPAPEGEIALAKSWLAALRRAFPEPTAPSKIRPGDRP
jgi:lysophospholipase L1-like esterase